MIKAKPILPKKGALEKDAIESLRKQISEKLKNVQCPDHHQRPEVIISGTVGNLKYEIKGCCQKLKDEATQALK